MGGFKTVSQWPSDRLMSLCQEVYPHEQPVSLTSVDEFVIRVLFHGSAHILSYALFASIHSPVSFRTVAGHATAAYVPSTQNLGIPCTADGPRGGI